MLNSFFFNVQAQLFFCYTQFILQEKDTCLSDEISTIRFTLFILNFAI